MSFVLYCYNLCVVFVGGFDVYNIETAMPKIDLDAIESHLRAAREEERRVSCMQCVTCLLILILIPDSNANAKAL